MYTHSTPFCYSINFYLHKCKCKIPISSDRSICTPWGCVHTHRYISALWLMDCFHVLIQRARVLNQHGLFWIVWIPTGQGMDSLHMVSVSKFRDAYSKSAVAWSWKSRHLYNPANHCKKNRAGTYCFARRSELISIRLTPTHWKYIHWFHAHYTVRDGLLGTCSIQRSKNWNNS